MPQKNRFKRIHPDYAEMLEEEEAQLRPGVSDEPYPRFACGECDLYFYTYRGVQDHRVEIHDWIKDPETGTIHKPEGEDNDD